MVSCRAIRVISHERLLGQNIQPGKQTKSLVEVEVIDVTSTFFVQELEDQQREQCARRGDHLGAWVAGVGDESWEAQAS